MPLFLVCDTCGFKYNKAYLEECCCYYTRGRKENKAILLINVIKVSDKTNGTVRYLKTMVIDILC